MTNNSEPKAKGVPVNIMTGEVASPDECAAMADKLTSGELKISFAPEALKQMAEKGLTEDDLRKAILDGVLAGVCKS